MMMRDPLHHIDHGVIVQLLKAIMRKYKEVLDLAFGSNVKVNAADRLKSRLLLMLKSRIVYAGEMRYTPL